MSQVRPPMRRVHAVLLVCLKMHRAHNCFCSALRALRHSSSVTLPSEQLWSDAMASSDLCTNDALDHHLLRHSHAWLLAAFKDLGRAS